MIQKNETFGQWHFLYLLICIPISSTLFLLYTNTHGRRLCRSIGISHCNSLMMVVVGFWSWCLQKKWVYLAHIINMGVYRCSSFAVAVLAKIISFILISFCWWFSSKTAAVCGDSGENIQSKLLLAWAN